MEYREIVSVTGMGGLFQLIATKSDGAIVRNLADQSTKFISARLHNVTPLESIEIYTTGNNVRLHEVLQKMKDSSEKMPDAKSAGNNEIKSYFKVISPELDEDRVYVSDMKKMLKWFDILGANDLLNFDIYTKEPETAEETAEEDVKEDQPAKKTARKKADESTEEEEVKEKPAKKTAAKKAAKKTEEPAGDVKEKPAKKTTAKKTARKKAE